MYKVHFCHCLEKQFLSSENEHPPVRYGKSHYLVHTVGWAPLHFQRGQTCKVEAILPCITNPGSARDRAAVSAY